MVTGIAAKPCDSCQTAPAVLFCRSDAVFLCLRCDADIHKLGLRHERVWLCEVCEGAPAVVTCKADAATLCATCDGDIHSANPLASRHDRVPVDSFFNSAESMVKSSSWLLMNQNFNSKLMEEEQLKSGDMFFSEMDSFLDFEYSDQVNGNDSVVPVQSKQTPAPAINHSNEKCFNIDFCRSKHSSFSYPSHTTSHSISSSSLDVGIVPDGANSFSEISHSFGRSAVEPCMSVPATAEQAVALGGLDREAKVLRYKEKKKNRRFEKTIRYASRKAYAETRPRIKGRFAKRNHIHTDLERIYSLAVADHQYGVVPI